MDKSVRKQRKIFGITSVGFFKVFAFIITSIISYLALIYPFSIRPYSYLLAIGDVAPQDISAPRSLSYQSELLTAQERSNAENSVADVYLPADTSIAKSQLEEIEKLLEYISVIREDEYSSMEQKVGDIQAIESIDIRDENAVKILQLSDSSWERIRVEVPRVLEQVMRNTIREDRIRDAQYNLSAYVSFSLGDEETQLVIDLIKPFIIPNSLYSEDQTLQAKQQAVDSITPVTTTFIEGETLVNRGQVITPLIYEALQAFDLVQPNRNPLVYVSVFVLIVIAIIYILLFIRRKNLPVVENLSSVLLISILFIIFLAGFRLLDPNQEMLLYIFPLTAFPLSVAYLYDREFSFGLIPVLAVFAVFGLPNSLVMLVNFIFSSFIGVLVLAKGKRIASFFNAGLTISMTGIMVLFAYHLTDTIIVWNRLLPLMGAVIVSGILASAFTLLFQFLFAQLLGVTTPLRLLDISRPDHPLLQLMLRETPGTYQHSLQVANLAERAAEAIKADSLLVRVGAMFHDAGKALNPTYFIENQAPGFPNPHDELDPETSSKIITKHVLDGLTLAKKFRLPPRVQDFMREHHGTMITNYQYTQAVQAANNDEEAVDKEKYRYIGPTPRSRETAILMLADGVEARARAMMPQDVTELRNLVNKAVEYLQQEGQLSDSNITLKDLHLIKESFVNTLKNTHHLRIQYPELNQEKADEDLTGNGQAEQETEE